MNRNYNNNNYNEYISEHKGKAVILAEKLKEKRDQLHKIEFRAGNKYHAVFLTEEQLHRAKVKAGEISLIDYYIKKYSA